MRRKCRPFFLAYFSLSFWRRAWPSGSRRKRFVQLRLEQLETRITPSGSTLSTLATFNGTNGSEPWAGLIKDGSGNLYGTTLSGGSYGYGTVFELAHGSGTITTMASFNGTNGSLPYGRLVLDSSGNLYGTTDLGGFEGGGTVFELAKGSDTISTLASLGGAVTGAGLIMDSSGNLYGTTPDGGAVYGMVFELAHGSGTITTLANFTGTNGAKPDGSLIMDSSGNLYGTTLTGGASYVNVGNPGYGTVFELAQGRGPIITLASFTKGFPRAALLMDSSGNLYGTTTGDLNGNDGSVFELAHGSGTITTLASFNGTNGSQPYAALIMDRGGNLYGTTDAGGASYDGTVFKLAHGSGTITTLASFNGTNGANPYATLIMDSSGNLYGTTFGGGASNDGTVFELSSGFVATFSPTLQWDDTNGADVGYSVTGVIAQGTTVDLYWASGNQFADVIGGPIAGASQVVPAGTAVGSYGPFHIDDATLGTPPSGATYLLAVADPNNLLGNFTEAQNVQALALAPDIVVDSVSTTDSRSLTVNYHVDNEAIQGPLTIGFYRSTTDQYEPQHASELTTLTVYDVSIGSHHETVSLPGGLVPNTITPYVLAVADPDKTLTETTTANNTASFRTYVIGAVVNGYDRTATGSGAPPPAWVSLMKTDLQLADGYDDAIAFSWASGAEDPNAIINAGEDLTAEIEAAAANIPNLMPNDVIDLHLIGHSRGTVVISEAIQNLIDDSVNFSTTGIVPYQLAHGYFKMTLLDPHPANLQYGLNASFAPSYTLPGLLLDLEAFRRYINFDVVVHDPKVFVPARVNEADVLFEKTATSALSGLVESEFINLHGLDPTNIDFQDPSQTQTLVYNMTGPGLGHSEVHDWYLNNVVLNSYLANNTTPAAFGPPSVPPTSDVISGGQVATLNSATLQTMLSMYTTMSIEVATNTDLQTGVIPAVNGLSSPLSPTVVAVILAPGTYGDSAFSPPPGVTVFLIGNGTTVTFVGHSPALMVTAGQVIVEGVTLTTDTDSPTVVVAGGNLILRDDTVQESTGGTDAAIAIASGTVDLGTANSPGNNILNVNGTGEFVQNTTGTLIPAIGNKLSTNGSPLANPNAFDLWQSTVTVSPNSFVASGSSTVTLTPRNAFGNLLPTGISSVGFSLAAGSGGGSLSRVTRNPDGTYSATFTSTIAGTDTITTKINGQTITSTAPTITVTPAAFDLVRSMLSIALSTVTAGSATTVILTPKDKYGNLSPTGITSVAFGFGAGTGNGILGAITPNPNGTYAASFQGAIAGTRMLTANINGHALASLSPSVKITPGVAVKMSMAYQNATAPATILAGTPLPSIVVQLLDAYGNAVSEESVSITLKLTGGSFAGIPTLTLKTNSHGQATFSGLIVNLVSVAGKPYRLDVMSPRTTANPLGFVEANSLLLNVLQNPSNKSHGVN